MVIKVISSSLDEELVELIEAVGKTAQEINSGRLKDEDKKEKIFYIDILVNRYIRIYHNTKYAIPNKSLFSEAINQYATNQTTLPEMVKTLMRELVMHPYEKCRNKYNMETVNAKAIFK